MLSRLKTFKRHWSVYAIVGLYLYLAIHALSGNQGIMRWVDYQDDIARHKKTLQVLQAEREELETQTEALGVNQLNLDMLDQKSREMLFVSYPKDITIFLDQTP